MRSKGVTTQMKTLDKSILNLLFVREFIFLQFLLVYCEREGFKVYSLLIP